jgi:hypothetical protein
MLPLSAPLEFSRLTSEVQSDLYLAHHPHDRLDRFGRKGTDLSEDVDDVTGPGAAYLPRG